MLRICNPRILLFVAAFSGLSLPAAAVAPVEAAQAPAAPAGAAPAPVQVPPAPAGAAQAPAPAAPAEAAAAFVRAFLQEDIERLAGFARFRDSVAGYVDYNPGFKFICESSAAATAECTRRGGLKALEISLSSSGGEPESKSESKTESEDGALLKAEARICYQDGSCAEHQVPMELLKAGGIWKVRLCSPAPLQPSRAAAAVAVQ